MRCCVTNMAKKAPPGFPSALKKTILSGMFTLNLSVLMLFRPNMGPARRLLSSHDWHCCWQRRPDCSLDLPDSRCPTLGRHLRCLPAQSSAVWLRCFGLRSLWSNDVGAVTEKKIKDTGGCECKRRKKGRQWQWGEWHNIFSDRTKTAETALHKNQPTRQWHCEKAVRKSDATATTVSWNSF